MVAGTASINTVRKVADNDERISSNWLRATCSEKVGSAAIAIDWAMADSGMIISVNARVRAVMLPSGWKDAR